MSTNNFWESPTYKLIAAMKAQGNQPSIIQIWKEAVEAWAILSQGDADAAAVRAWLPHWQVRPAYTAEELAPLWPVLAVALNLVDRPFPIIPAARLTFLLDYGDLPSREVRGTRYFIVERLHYWREASQEEFENVLCR